MNSRSKINFDIKSECGVLREVLIAPAATFRLCKPINNTQRYYYKNSPPTRKLIVKQHKAFWDALVAAGVTVRLSTKSTTCPLQINVRDVATVIGKTFVVCSLKETVRQKEPSTLTEILNHADGKILQVDNGVVEGGDVQLAHGKMFVGISQRTNKTGFKWVSENFKGEFDVMPVFLRSPFLHLDVVFNIVRPNLALVYPPAIEPNSLKEITKVFDIIEVSAEEQFQLACNTLSISPKLVVVDKASNRINRILNKNGIETIELDFSDVRKLGGSFRCATCPLVRDAV